MIEADPKLDAKIRQLKKLFGADRLIVVVRQWMSRHPGDTIKDSFVKIWEAFFGSGTVFVGSANSVIGTESKPRIIRDGFRTPCVSCSDSACDHLPKTRASVP